MPTIRTQLCLSSLFQWQNGPCMEHIISQFASGIQWQRGQLGATPFGLAQRIQPMDFPSSAPSRLGYGEAAVDLPSVSALANFSWASNALCVRSPADFDQRGNGGSSTAAFPYPERVGAELGSSIGWTSVYSRKESLRAAPFAIPHATAFLLPSAHNDQVKVLQEQHRRVHNRNDSFELVTRRDPDIDARSLEIRNRLRHIRIPAVGPR
ncbi:hypothetical protein CF326_g1141 [Tilletia indica]|nr:hypothetical protein CF326_g1141 [Tilletia indica]